MWLLFVCTNSDNKKAFTTILIPECPKKKKYLEYHDWSHAWSNSLTTFQIKAKSCRHSHIFIFICNYSIIAIILNNKIIDSLKIPFVPMRWMTVFKLQMAVYLSITQEDFEDWVGEGDVEGLICNAIWATPQCQLARSVSSTSLPKISPRLQEMILFSLCTLYLNICNLEKFLLPNLPDSK